MQLLASRTGWVSPTHRSLPRVRLLRPGSASEAVAAHTEEGPDARYHCGGTDLAAQFREGLAPSALVHLGGVQELRSITHTDDGLHLGAGVDHATGSLAPDVVSLLPGLADGWGRIATVRIRFTATLGGNLMARRTRYEMPIMLRALGARLRFLGPDGVFETEPADLWEDAPPAASLLLGARIPEPGRVQLAYDRSLRPVMTVAVALRETDTGIHGRAVLGSEYRAPRAVDFDLTDHPRGEAGLTALAQDTAARFDDSVGDTVTSAHYRRRAAAVLIRRRLQHLLKGA